MIYQHNRRLVVQKPGTNVKYILPVPSATVDHSYPFTVPTASINIIQNDGIYDYISDITVDDIIRFQVSNTFNGEKDVYQDRFQGRINSIKSQYGNANTATIQAVGHSIEANHRTIMETHSFTLGDAGSVATYFNSVLYRTQVTVPVTPTFDTTYSVETDKKKVFDVFRDLESNSGYSYFFNDVPVYDNSLNLSRVDIEFKQMPTVATTKYAVVQGSPGLVSANFTVDGTDIYNEIIVHGASGFGANAIDTPSSDMYNLRTTSVTDNSFTDNATCQTLANGLLPYTKDVKVTGTVKIQGTAEPCIGDYVYIDIKDEDVNGSSLQAYMHVVRVTDNYSEESDSITLQFGRVQKGPTDYIAQFKTFNRKLENMFIN